MKKFARLLLELILLQWIILLGILAAIMPGFLLYCLYDVLTYRRH